MVDYLKKYISRKTHVLTFKTINREYKLKRCLNKKRGKQCRHFKFKGTMTEMTSTKTNTYNSSKHAEQQDVTVIQNKLF